MSTKPITHIKKDDPVMLKQQIMYLKSELVQYEKKVKDYQNNYHYSMIESLKRENGVLKEDLASLKNNIHELESSKQKEIERLNSEIQHMKNEYEEKLQAQVQKDQNPEVELMKQEITNLKKQIKEYNENGETFIKDLLNEKEEYMEKWETLKIELQKVIQEQAKNYQQNHQEENTVQKEATESDWFTTNLNLMKRNGE